MIVKRRILLDNNHFAYFWQPCEKGIPERLSTLEFLLLVQLSRFLYYTACYLLPVTDKLRLAQRIKSPV